MLMAAAWPAADWNDDRDQEEEGRPRRRARGSPPLEEFSPRPPRRRRRPLRSVFGPMIETMLKAELEAHLGHPDNDKGPKDEAEREPRWCERRRGPHRRARDRGATFEPRWLTRPDRHRVARDVDVRRGMCSATVREIRLLERRDGRLPPTGCGRSSSGGAGWSPCTRSIRRLTWRAQHGGLRDSRLAGQAQDVLGLWMQETEGAHHWMGVFDELRQRGVKTCCS